MTQNNLFSAEGGEHSDLNFQMKGEMDIIENDWNIPTEYPDLTGYKEVAVDLETKDPNIKTLGPAGRGTMGISSASPLQLGNTKATSQSATRTGTTSIQRSRCVGSRSRCLSQRWT
jgi:hypothetical protein